MTLCVSDWQIVYTMQLYLHYLSGANKYLLCLYMTEEVNAMGSHGKKNVEGEERRKKKKSERDKI